MDCGIGVIKEALDFLVARHQMIANNIANAGTPDFRPSDLVFRDVLSTRLKTSSPEPSRHLETEVRPLKGPVQLDEEMARLAENSLRYYALTQFAGRKFSQLSLIINEGRKV
ncbi:MAG: hypothetical protein V2A78_10340 [bacterium]